MKLELQTRRPVDSNIYPVQNQNGPFPTKSLIQSHWNNSNESQVAANKLITYRLQQKTVIRITIGRP